MKRQLHIIIFISLLISGNIDAQITFERTYSTGSTSWGQSVQQLDDNGYLFSGYSYGTFGFIYLTRTNQYGDTIWNKFYPGWMDDYGSSLMIDDHQQVVICGTAIVQMNDAELIKADLNGDTLWMNHYGGNDEGSANAIDQSFDGGYIMTGKSNSNVNLVKTDSNGVFQWQKTYADLFLNVGLDVIQTHDSGYAVCGYTTYITKGPVQDIALIFVLKTNKNGDFLWSRSIDYFCGQAAYSLIETSDSGFLLCGYSNPSGYLGHTSVFLLKLNESGDSIWSATFPLNSEWNEGRCVSKCSNGNYVVCGFTGTYGGDVDGFIMEIGPLGNLLWSSVYGGESPDKLNNVKETSDQGFIACGYSKSFGNSQKKVYLVKTDENGFVSAIPEIRENDAVVIFPNPCNGTFRIQSDQKINKIIVFASDGRTIFKKDLSSSEKNNVSMSIPAIKPGIYTLTIYSDKQIISKKLIIQ